MDGAATTMKDNSSVSGLTAAVAAGIAQHSATTGRFAGAEDLPVQHAWESPVTAAHDETCPKHEARARTASAAQNFRIILG